MPCPMCGEPFHHGDVFWISSRHDVRKRTCSKCQYSDLYDVVKRCTIAIYTFGEVAEPW